MTEATLLSAEERLLTSKAVRYLLGDCSEMTIWRRIKDGTIPAPTKIHRRNYWRKSDIDAVINAGLPGAVPSAADNSEHDRAA